MARSNYYGVDVYNNLPSGFESRSNYAYNPSSGSYLFKGPDGRQMLDAPWLSSPQPFGGTNYGSQPAPKPVKQKAQGITITGGTGSYTNDKTGTEYVSQPDGSYAPKGGGNKGGGNKGGNNSGGNNNFDMEAFLEAQERSAEKAAERARKEAQERLQRELMGQASALTGMASGYGINDLTQINSALAQLYGLQGQAAGSGINLGSVDGTIDQLKGLLGQRSSEQNRYDQFVNNFNRQATAAGDYGVNDLDAINAAMNQFQGYQSGAKGFNSDLNVDTGFLQNRSGGILDQLQRTLDERNRQQGIVDDTRAGLEDFIGNFGNAYNAIDYRNADQINALEGQLDPINTGTIDGIDLNFDFSDLASQTGGFMDMLGKLRGRRSDDLDDYSGGLSELADSIGGFFGNSDPRRETRPDGSIMDTIPGGIINDKPLPGELPAPISEGGATLRDIQSAREVYGVRDDLREMQQQLDAYGSGDRVNKFREQLFELQAQYGDISDALGDRQDDIDTRAGSFLDQMMGGSGITELSQINDLQAKYNALASERDMFDARDADQELSQAMGIIGEQRSRLERERDIKARQAERERQMGGSTVMTPAFARQFMNDAEYQAFLASLEQAREDPSGAGAATSFARSLGLA